MNLIIVGTVAFDGIETPWSKADRVIGGSATYAGIAASYYASPGIVGVVGEDFTRDHIALIEKFGVNTEGIVHEKGKSFYWAGRYEEDVNVRTTLVTELNVLEKFNPILPENYKNTEYLFLANVDPDLQASVLDQCDNLKFCVMDTMNFWIDTKKKSLDKIIQRVDGILINDEEAKMLCGTPNLLAAAKAILKGNPRVVIVKKGEHGVMMVTEDDVFTLPGYPLDKVSDPTGAGDCFAGGFIGYISKSKDTTPETLRKAVVAGSATASYCCEDFSIERFHTLNREQLAKRIENFVKLSRFEAPEI